MIMLVAALIVAATAAFAALHRAEAPNCSRAFGFSHHLARHQDARGAALSQIRSDWCQEKPDIPVIQSRVERWWLSGLPRPE
jgi:hypothetical protein